ncbi:sensor histidine kinase [Calothrix sp. PCC 7507]|uniref:sensor histidine kinase n=1 Tax=Calothrix sp. PCC 7507 TaxID=99598 RepID=UPI00029F2804|nr:ATP-binding protein [Calothrix sp. PCC 7507]AFY32872.1 histidine kinase [Calothrix sp. PCC 7507]
MVRIPYLDLAAKPFLDVTTYNFTLESTLQELPLWELKFDISEFSFELAEKFQANPLLPGVLLVEGSELVGMISRQRFLEYVIWPQILEKFSDCSLKVLDQFLRSDFLILPGEMLILGAAQKSLERQPELIYEPIVVRLGIQKYGIVDARQLLVAQSRICELTTKVLREQNIQQLFQTEKLASLGRMVAGITHEIRNPVNCIAGNIPFLLKYFQELIELISAYETEYSNSSPIIQEIKDKIDLDFIASDLPQILNSINISSERLRQIITSLCSFSAKTENKRQPADIHACIDSTLLILKHQMHQDIEIVKNYGDLPLINCYSGQMSQVFMNLLNNAMDALYDKIKTIKNWQPCIEISTKVVREETQQWVVVIIADNGVGIPPEIQKQIFEDFFTTKPVGKGTGLGLAISYEIVTQRHGGQLQVTSQPGIGTEFEIWLPLANTQ